MWNNIERLKQLDEKIDDTMRVRALNIYSCMERTEELNRVLLDKVNKIEMRLEKLEQALSLNGERRRLGSISKVSA